MTFTTYILYSASLAQHYTGHTEDMDKRLAEHRQGESEWTSRATDWVMMYSQVHRSRAEASRQERRIKKEGASKYLRLRGLVTRSEA